MRLQRVVGHQLVRDLFRERRIQPAADVDCREFLVLAFVVSFEFLAFKHQVGLLGVRLGMDRYVLSCGHRHRSGDQPGHSRHHYVAMSRMRRRDAQHQARCGKDSIVRAQYRRAQPAAAFRAVDFLFA